MHLHLKSHCISSIVLLTKYRLESLLKNEQGANILKWITRSIAMQQIKY